MKSFLRSVEPRPIKTLREREGGERERGERKGEGERERERKGERERELST